MELTQAQIVALIEQLIADNTTGEITALDVRTAMTQMVGYTAQTDAKVNAVVILANAAMDLADANKLTLDSHGGRITTEEEATVRIDGELQNIRDSIENIMESGDASGLTAEQVRLNKVARDANTQGRIDNAMAILGLQGDVATLQTNEATQNTAIGTAQATATRAEGKADTANTDLNSALTRIGANEVAIANLPEGGTTEAEKTQIARIDGIASDTADNTQGIADVNTRIDELPTGGGDVSNTYLQEQTATLRDIDTADSARFGEVTARQDIIDVNFVASGSIRGNSPFIVSQTLSLGYQLENQILEILSARTAGGVLTLSGDLTYTASNRLDLDVVLVLQNTSPPIGGTGNLEYPIATHERSALASGTQLTNEYPWSIDIPKDDIVGLLPKNISLRVTSRNNVDIGTAQIPYDFRASYLIATYKGDFVDPTNQLIGARLADIGQGVSESDFLTRSGATSAQTPGIAYRGSGDQAYVNANPGVLFERATGQFTVPAVTLADVPAGTPFRWSQAYLNAGKTGRQSGFDPILYYVIEQGGNRIVGRGAVDSTDDLATNWVALDNIESPSELRTDHLVTGEPFIVRWIAIYNGEDATIAPSLSGGEVGFAGRFEPAIEGIVHDVTDARFNTVEATARTLQGTVTAEAVQGASTKRLAEGNAGRLDGVVGRLDAPQLEVIEEGTIVDVASATIDATPLNNTLGVSGQPFARSATDAIGQATQFITRITDSHQVLDYGAGRVADVFDGNVRIFVLVPEQDPRTDTETRYITTPSGYGTRTRPAVLEFGIAPAGSNVKQARDSEVFLDTGIPAEVLPSGTTVSNVSMAFGIRTNDNWAGISETLQFAIRSGETRSFPIPAPIREMTMTATALADGRIQCRATHNGGVGNANDVVTNAGAIRFDAGYVETVVTPRIPRGQTTVDGGAFTGNNLIAIDVKQAGDSDTETATIVTPTATYDTGYFLREVHRTGFRTENQAFNVFVSDADSPLTPAVLAQLDGTDQFLGLFARNNHHATVLRLLKGLQAPTSDGTASYNLADQIQILLAEAGSGEGLTMEQIEAIVRTEIGESDTVQANSAKVGVDEALLNRVAANDLKPDSVAVRSIAGTAITEELTPTGAIRRELDEIVASGGGTTAQEKLDIATNNQKRSYTAEFQGVTDSNTIRITNHDTLFGATLVGDWESGEDLVSLGNLTSLKIGDVVSQDAELFIALEDITSVGSSFAPDASPNSWRKYEVQTQPYDATALTQLINGKTTPAEAKAQAVDAIGESLVAGQPIADAIAQAGLTGTTLTPQEVAQALADNQATNPLHYNVKFSQDTSRQVAEPFRTDVFNQLDLKNDSTDTATTLKLLPDNTSVANNVLNSIPFDSRWEGALRVATLDNGSAGDANRNTLLRVTRQFKHFAGQTDSAGNSLEFTEYRRYIFRMTKEYAQDIPMNIFNTSVQLPENVTSDARYTALAMQNIEVNFIFELFGSQADVTNNNPSARNTYPGAFTIDWDGVGVRYSQLAAVANTGDVYTDAMAKAQATEALAEGLATGGDIETAIQASSGAKASDLARGAYQLGLQGTGGINFTINLPTDTLPGETTLSGVLRIQSIGGFTPSGYTYHVRYSDGDRAIIFGNTTIPFTAGETVINLTRYDISSGRPIEVDVAVNGGGGSSHPWSLELTVGEGEEGVLYTPTLDLISQLAPMVTEADFVVGETRKLVQGWVADSDIKENNTGTSTTGVRTPELTVQLPESFERDADGLARLTYTITLFHDAIPANSLQQRIRAFDDDSTEVDGVDLSHNYITFPANGTDTQTTFTRTLRFDPSVREATRVSMTISNNTLVQNTSRRVGWAFDNVGFDSNVGGGRFYEPVLAIAQTVSGGGGTAGATPEEAEAIATNTADIASLKDRPIGATDEQATQLGTNTSDIADLKARPVGATTEQAKAIETNTDNIATLMEGGGGGIDEQAIIDAIVLDNSEKEIVLPNSPRSVSGRTQYQIPLPNGFPFGRPSYTFRIRQATSNSTTWGVRYVDTKQVIFNGSSTAGTRNINFDPTREIEIFVTSAGSPSFETDGLLIIVGAGSPSATDSPLTTAIKGVVNRVLLDGGIG